MEHAFGQPRLFALGAKGRVQAVDRTSGRLVPPSIHDRSTVIFSAFVTPDGNRLTTAEPSGAVVRRLDGSATGETLPPQSAGNLAAGNDVVVAGSFEGDLPVLDPRTLEPSAAALPAINGAATELVL